MTEVARSLEQAAAQRSVTTVPGGRLELAPATGPSDVPSLGVARVRPARVRYARWRPAIQVTIEVEHWSNEASALMIRPTRRPPHDAYYAAALAAAEALAVEVERAREESAPAVADATPVLEHWRRAS